MQIIERICIVVMIVGPPLALWLWYVASVPKPTLCSSNSVAHLDFRTMQRVE